MPNNNVSAAKLNAVSKKVGTPIVCNKLNVSAASTV
jgi:hypothetical protein